MNLWYGGFISDKYGHPAGNDLRIYEHGSKNKNISFLHSFQECRRQQSSSGSGPAKAGNSMRPSEGAGGFSR